MKDKLSFGSLGFPEATITVECGFLSNPDEAAKLQEESYQEEIAEQIIMKEKML